MVAVTCTVECGGQGRAHVSIKDCTTVQWVQQGCGALVSVSGISELWSQYPAELGRRSWPMRWKVRLWITFWPSLQQRVWMRCFDS
jgi:hypothetical protein